MLLFVVFVDDVVVVVVFVVFVVVCFFIDHSVPIVSPQEPQNTKKRKDFKSSKHKTAAFAFTHCKLYTFKYRTAFAMVLEQLQKLREIDALYIEKNLYCKLFYTIQ